jgi:hypothetical protein
MRAQLSAAFQSGLVLGVRVATALLVVIVALSWWMGDYWTIRQQAAHGEQAFQFIAQQQRTQQQSPAAAASK